MFDDQDGIRTLEGSRVDGETEAIFGYIMVEGVLKLMKITKSQIWNSNSQVG